MLRLLLVRHGETEWNAQHRYQGQTDVPLSAVGIEQAGLLAKRLSHEMIDVAFSSDLARARRTAEIITRGRGLALLIEPRLREMNFGVLEGLTFEGAQARHADAISAWLQDYNQPPPGGEDLDTFAGRVNSVLSALQDEHQDQTVLLVAHGGPLSEMARLVLELPYTHRWAFLMSNAALSEIQLTAGSPFIKVWNETCHLNGDSPDRTV